jgi:hypothetical protein
VFVTSIEAVYLGSCDSLGVVYVRGPSLSYLLPLREHQLSAVLLGMLRDEMAALVLRYRDLSVCICRSFDFLLSESNVLQLMFCRMSSTPSRHLIICFITVVLNLFLFPCRPPLLVSGQSSWLQIQRSGFDSRRFQIF